MVNLCVLGSDHENSGGNCCDFSVYCNVAVVCQFMCVALYCAYSCGPAMVYFVIWIMNEDVWWIFSCAITCALVAVFTCIMLGTGTRTRALRVWGDRPTHKLRDFYQLLCEYVVHVICRVLLPMKVIVIVVILRLFFCVKYVWYVYLQ